MFESVRKIIHIDMDCFYAAIEERDHPHLRGKPVGVGGSTRRGVLTTANYEARKFGCRSAMPIFHALELCPQLLVVPIRFEVYRKESERIRKILERFTPKIEPLSLDEAYLDVSHLRTPAATIAREIRTQIREETGLRASAGIGPNKLIAKIASDWNKPDGQFEVTSAGMVAFLSALPVARLWGVGPKSKTRLAKLGIHTCGDLQRASKLDLARKLGARGAELHDLAHGIDDRVVRTSRIRKSLSSEHTFAEDIHTIDKLIPSLREQYAGVREDLAHHHADRPIRSLVVKLKFADFTRTTAERSHPTMDPEIYQELLAEAWKRRAGQPVRLLGLGVRFRAPLDPTQLDLF